MARLSVTIITYNEADRIDEALDSVRFADEVVVVDAGSTDGTAEKCRAWGARVLRHPFDGFVAQKQFALEQAVHPWVLAIDADEAVSPALAASIQRALDGVPVEAGFTCARRNYYLGTPIRFAGWYPDRKLRLVARERARWTGVDPHDRLEVDGQVGALEGDLLHRSYRDLEDHVARIRRYARVSAQRKLEAGQRARLIDLVFRPIHYFLRRFFLGQGFREGRIGLILCGMGAFHVFLKYACLYELERSGARPAVREGVASGRDGGT